MRARFVSSRKSDLDRNERNRVKIGRKRNHLLGDHPSNAPIPPFPPRTGWKPWRIRWSWRRFRGGRGYGRPSSSRGEAASPQRYRPEGGPWSRSRGGISQPSRRSLGQLGCPPSRTRIIFRSPSLQQRYSFHHRSPISTSFLALRFPCYEVRDVRKITIHQMVVDNFNLGAKIFEFISWMERRVMGRKVRKINTCLPDIICGLVVCKWISSAHAHVTIPLDVSAAMHLAANIIEFPFIPRIWIFIILWNAFNV